MRAHIAKTTFLATTLLGGALAAHAPAPRAHGGDEPRRVDLAICLDTSGSMNGLIDAARQSIWAIVNDLALAKPTPKLRLALLTFGNDGHDKARGWVAVQTPFTEDLDLVSQKLFALTTNGGTELVGRVVQTSLDELSWSDDKNALKLIVVAGNESADQDREVPFADACKRAISRGVMINSIYCGNPSDNLAPAWQQVAKLADGQFHAIDHNAGTVVVATPFDQQLQALSASLNETYLPYGQNGQAAWSEQKKQDGNAEKLNQQAAATRAFCKANPLYLNSTWDLVDACRLKKVDLAKIDPKELPENLQKMTPEQRVAHVAELQKKRDAIQKQIHDVNGKREAFVAEEMKKNALDPTKSFDYAVRKAVQEQAASKGLKVPQRVPGTAPNGK